MCIRDRGTASGLLNLLIALAGTVTPAIPDQKNCFLSLANGPFPDLGRNASGFKVLLPVYRKVIVAPFLALASLKRTWLGLGRSKRLLFLVGGFGFRGAGIGLLGLVFRGLLLVLLRVFLPCAQLLGNRIEMLAQHGVLFRRQLLRIVQ